MQVRFAAVDSLSHCTHQLGKLGSSLVHAVMGKELVKSTAVQPTLQKPLAGAVYKRQRKQQFALSGGTGAPQRPAQSRFSARSSIAATTRYCAKRHKWRHTLLQPHRLLDMHLAGVRQLQVGPQTSHLASRPSKAARRQLRTGRKPCTELHKVTLRFTKTSAHKAIDTLESCFAQRTYLFENLFKDGVYFSDCS